VIGVSTTHGAPPRRVAAARNLRVAGTVEDIICRVLRLRGRVDQELDRREAS
jgi:hypothetical protein